MSYTKRDYPVLLPLKAKAALEATQEAAKIVSKLPHTFHSFHIQESAGRFLLRAFSATLEPNEKNLTELLGVLYKEEAEPQGGFVPSRSRGGGK